VDVIEQKFELRVDYVRHYSVNFFYKKPIRFHYIDDLNSINYKAITSKKLSTDFIRTQSGMSIENENNSQFGLWCKGCSKLKSCDKDTSGMLSLNNTTNLRRKLLLLRRKKMVWSENLKLHSHLTSSLSVLRRGWG